MPSELASRAESSRGNEPQISILGIALFELRPLLGMHTKTAAYGEARKGADLSARSNPNQALRRQARLSLPFSNSTVPSGRLSSTLQRSEACSPTPCGQG